jgi:hypothetical protein
MLAVAKRPFDSVAEYAVTTEVQKQLAVWADVEGELCASPYSEAAISRLPCQNGQKIERERFDWQ